MRKVSQLRTLAFVCCKLLEINRKRIATQAPRSANRVGLEAAYNEEVAVSRGGTRVGNWARKQRVFSMKIGQKPIIKQAMGMVIGWAMVAGVAASTNANPVTVTDITDWGTTPNEVVYAGLPYLHYNGGVYAGINTLLINNGKTSTVSSGFCIDPFHWSASGPSSPYYIVPLDDAPKSPAKLNAATALDIEDLWAEFYSPTMTSAHAAGLQIAIWELVSANAVAHDGLPAADAFYLDGPNDFGASEDIASLATYHGPAAHLLALTGPGQDYVVGKVPDAGGTLLMLALTLGALVLARPAIIKSVAQRQQAIPVNGRGQARG
jgi:hypothetical protein